MPAPENSDYNILFIGDVVGRPGRDAVLHFLPALKSKYEPLFTIINGENAAGGVGITSDIADAFFHQGADVITLGNHAFNKREIFGYLDSSRPIVRPANASAAAPGKGLVTISKGGIDLHVLNLCGRVYMDGYDDPFAAVDRLIHDMPSSHRFLDFHGEATSEKIAMGYHLNGRFSAVVGTHTHVQTADERILSGGTAAITDVGMTGPAGSVLGMDTDLILRRFLTGLPEKFEVAKGPGVICGVVISVKKESGRATAITRVQYGGENGLPDIGE